MSRVSKSYPGGKQVIKDISLSFFRGAKIGVLGLNGSGKSTLLKIMAGLDTDFRGEVSWKPGFTVGILAQEPQLDEHKTVRECVEEGVASTIEVMKRFEAVSTELGDPNVDADRMTELLEEQAKLQEQVDALNGWELDHRLEIAMDALRLPPPDAKVAPLSGGERRRVALCRLLLQKPDILLLDEPTNHLDAESVLWLEQFLQQYDGTVVAVTHDRYFLDNSAEWILELDRGEGIPWKGNYTSWLEQKQKRLELEEKVESKRAKTLERELEWIRASPRARQAKSKARVTAYEELLAQESRERVDDIEIYIPAGPRLGDRVIEAQGISKAYEGRVLFDNLSFQIRPGSIVGIIGANGAGKSTLFRMIAKQEKPDSGTLLIGDAVQLAYVDQSRDTLDGEKMVWEEISGVSTDTMLLGKRPVSARGYASRFNFTGSDQQKKVKQLSGGERNRVHLGKLLREGSNVLLLDEPTNDLDVNTLRALEEAILNFAGCVLVISHDRWFLDRICTHIMAFEGDSKVEFLEGNLQDYEADKKRRLGADAVQPKRIKFKRLSHD